MVGRVNVNRAGYQKEPSAGKSKKTYYNMCCWTMPTTDKKIALIEQKQS